MKTIYKYQVPVNDHFTLELPEGARILSVQVQRGRAQLWALVDPAAPPARRDFMQYGTGHSVQPFNGRALDYIGTYQLSEGDLILHLFELTGAQ